MNTQTITDGFRKLDPDEKIRLLRELWDEIADEGARTPVSEADRRFLDDRLRQHEENPEDVEDWETARDEIIADL